MSGGYFDYDQFRMHDMAEKIKRVIKTHGHLSIRTKREFNKAVKLLTETETYVQRIDWLLSSDDGEETFHVRLKEDLAKLK